jgi:hypothetical protein
MKLFAERFYYRLLYTKAILLHLKFTAIVAYTLMNNCPTSVLKSARNICLRATIWLKLFNILRLLATRVLCNHTTM